MDSHHNSTLAQKYMKKKWGFPVLTIFGRSLLLMICEVAANAICWAVAGILFASHKETRPTLGLALLAWTLGLRHALDADHISAIDNATRCLINMNQYPVTCGLFFSLGHSTIVIVVTFAIAISSSVYERINGVGEVGGIIGASVSGSFMFIIGVANSIILWKIIRRRRESRKRRLQNNGIDPLHDQHPPKENNMLMMRILGPIINFVNRPWKMYPVGVLFGLGFDTASSIALLAVSALAKSRSTDEHTIPSSHIIILPLLFTAGMTLIDSADSVLMLHSYAGVPVWPVQIFEWETCQTNLVESTGDHVLAATHDLEKKPVQEAISDLDTKESTFNSVTEKIAIQRKLTVMSGLSIILTIMSILVAFSISLITIMGLIGEQCKSCVEAAEAGDGNGGGLAGRWWRAWAAAGEQSGYIGIGIVGVFVVIVALWYGTRLAMDKAKHTRQPM